MLFLLACLPHRARSLGKFGLCWLGFVICAAQAQTTTLQPLDLPLEELVQTDVITAAKLAQQISGATSAVAIFTAQDIRSHGYQSLSDVLMGIRGLSMVNDTQYGYLAGRGFSSPTDYTGRILVLLDGDSIADPYFEQNYFGVDGLIDLDLVERIEYIPGAGSVDYGNSALLGVINIVTKTVGNYAKNEIGLEAGSDHSHKVRLSLNSRLDSGLRLQLSVSSYGSDAREAFYPTDHPFIMSNQVGQRLFLKAQWESWTLNYLESIRTDYQPIPSPATQTDFNRHFSLHYDTNWDSSTKVSLEISNHIYNYDQTTVNDGSVLSGFCFTDLCNTNILGRSEQVDFKISSTRWDDHLAVWGAQWLYYSNIHWQSYWDELSPTSRIVRSVYAYDLYNITPQWQLTYGGRYETVYDIPTLAPRLALSYRPRPSTTVSYTSSIGHYRPGYTKAYPDYEADQIEVAHTNEITWIERWGADKRFTASIYNYAIDRRYNADDPTTPINIITRGAEAEWEQSWNDTSRLRLSYARQDSQYSTDTPAYLLPQDIVKIHWSHPLIGEQMRLGLEALYFSERLSVPLYFTLPPGHLPDYGLLNITLSGQSLSGWRYVFAIRNLLDSSAADYLNCDPSATTTCHQKSQKAWLQVVREF